jgi:hypothetical protein
MREPPPDCEPLWHDDDDWDLAPVDPRLHDLRGQGRHGALLTEERLRAITDITGSYLMTPDQEIRAAITKLRGLTADVLTDMADNPYWASTEHPPHAYPNVYARGVDNGLGGPSGKFAAAMHPGVGTLLADWLDLEETYLVGMPENERLAHVRAALAVARAINAGGQP